MIKVKKFIPFLKGCPNTPNAWTDYINENSLQKDYGFSNSSDCEKWINENKKNIKGECEIKELTHNEFSTLDEAISELRLARPLVDLYRKVCPAERYGQATFNVLELIYPIEVNMLRSKKGIDPFYKDEYVDAFYSELAKLIKVSRVEDISLLTASLKIKLTLERGKKRM